MKSAIKKIDRAIKKLYNIDLPYHAEDFLVSQEVKKQVQLRAGKTENEALRGALYLHSGTSEESSRELSLGIYLSETVRSQLSKLRPDPRLWSASEMGAFTIATEEISHFHYLLYHASQGRSVRQLELELHGEIDKFILAFFAGSYSPDDLKVWFEDLFERLFVSFRWRDDLSEEEASRYREASDFAKKFVRKIERNLASSHTYEKALRLLRWFYRLSSADKISFLQGS